jgi:hypothetical protein
MGKKKAGIVRTMPRKSVRHGTAHYRTLARDFEDVPCHLRLPINTVVREKMSREEYCLVKIPRDVRDAWAAAGEGADLGSLVMRAVGDGTRWDLDTLSGEQLKLTSRDTVNQCRLVFKDTTKEKGEAVRERDGPKYKLQPSMVAYVLDAKPVITERYSSSVRNRVEATMRQDRSNKTLLRATSAKRKLAEVDSKAGGGGKKAKKVKKFRAENEDVVINSILALFQNKDYVSKKEIVMATREPDRTLKPILAKVCEKITEGEFRHKYRLSELYSGGDGADVQAYTR